MRVAIYMVMSRVNVATKKRGRDFAINYYGVRVTWHIKRVGGYSHKHHLSASAPARSLFAFHSSSWKKLI